MNAALNTFKILVGAAATTFGALAVTGDLPASWHRGVMIGLAVATALSQFMNKIGSPPASAPSEPEKK